MYKEHWQYIWGHHEKGVVDCSGAFYYSYKILHGLPMYNGSNRIARVYIAGNLIPFKEAREKGLILPGMAAFKHKAPGQSGYNLGSGYKPNGAYYNGDLNDYYHIGTVDDDINYVLNAQSAKTGFVRSKITENWSHVARMKNIDYGGDPVEEKTMVVIRTPDTSSGTNTVNVRTSPNGSVLFTVYFGSVVQKSEDNGEWSKITFGGKTGWMMSKFLRDQEQGSDISPELRALLNKVDVASKEISNDLNQIFTIIGRG